MKNEKKKKESWRQKHNGTRIALLMCPNGVMYC